MKRDVLAAVFRLVAEELQRESNITLIFDLLWLHSLTLCLAAFYLQIMKRDVLAAVVFLMNCNKRKNKTQRLSQTHACMLERESTPKLALTTGTTICKTKNRVALDPSQIESRRK